MTAEAETQLPIPYGWYCVGYSDELGSGEVQRLHYFGLDLVLFRTASGVPGLARAHCPHLGAHLGFGRMDGEALRCPFHDCAFDVSGHCVDVPFASGISPETREEQRLETIPLVEQNGFLWGWYHPRGSDPLFPVHEFQEISSGEWAGYEKHDWRVGTHVQESGENAVDTAHFPAVHKLGGVLARPEVSFDAHLRSSEIALELARVNETTSWEDGEFVEGRILTVSSGPGQTWTRQLGLADVIIIGLPTPVDPGCLHLRLACSVPKSQLESRGALSGIIIQHVVEQVEQDIPIWENKIYQPHPILCDGDGPIAEYRKWFSQFYAD